MRYVPALRRAVAVALPIALLACDGITFPDWQTEWAVQSGASVALKSILPSTIELDGDVFVVDMSPVSLAAPLSLLCPACASQAGTDAHVAKRAFAFEATTHIALPADVDSLELGTGNTLHLALGHSFAFDPLRPSAAPGSATGHVRVVVQTAGAVLADLTSDGSETPWSPGDSLRWDIPLADHTPVAGTVAVTLTLDSPEGDSALASPDGAELRLDATLTQVRARSVDLLVRDRAVNSKLEVDFGKLTSDLLSRADSITLQFAVLNPYPIDGTVSLDWAMPEIPIDTVPLLPSGSVSRSTPLTKPMLEALAGRKVTVQIHGDVSATSERGYVRLEPISDLEVVVTVHAVLSSGTLVGSS